MNEIHLEIPKIYGVHAGIGVMMLPTSLEAIPKDETVLFDLFLRDA